MCSPTVCSVASSQCACGFLLSCGLVRTAPGSFCSQSHVLARPGPHGQAGWACPALASPSTPFLHAGLVHPCPWPGRLLGSTPHLLGTLCLSSHLERPSTGTRCLIEDKPSPADVWLDTCFFLYSAHHGFSLCVCPHRHVFLSACFSVFPPGQRPVRAGSLSGFSLPAPDWFPVHCRSPANICQKRARMRTEGRPGPQPGGPTISVCPGLPCCEAFSLKPRQLQGNWPSVHPWRTGCVEVCMLLNVHSLRKSSVWVLGVVPARVPGQACAIPGKQVASSSCPHVAGEVGLTPPNSAPVGSASVLAPAAQLVPTCVRLLGGCNRTPLTGGLKG